MDIKSALVSCYNKEGIVNFVGYLRDEGYKIISTSGTANLLMNNGITVKQISDITKFPEILNGRVKTLHPVIFGGLLVDKNDKEHILEREMERHNISPIDIVVVNLYPFKSVVSKEHTLNDAIENIDIGGVALIRAAAKNYRNVTVVVDPMDYNILIEEIKNYGEISMSTKEKLGVKAFAYVSDYDIAIYNYLSKRFAGFKNENFTDNFFISGKKIYDVRYGENPHQKAAIYTTNKNFLIDSIVYEGKRLSFNNILDIDLALKIVVEFKEECCCIVKHAIPCGVAIGKDLDKAYNYAYECDSKSAFGGIFGFNGKVTEYIAERLSKIFFECIIANDYEDQALKILQKKKNLRILKKDVKDLKNSNEYDIRKFFGGFMIQDEDKNGLTFDELKNLPVVTTKKPSDDEYKAMVFAEKVVKHVRSNAIVLAKSDNSCIYTVGIGSGQTSRVDAVSIAVSKSEKGSSKYKPHNAVLSSDAFFSFRDGIDEAAKGKISAIIQPGGSIWDKDMIEACNEHNIAMVFTNIRHFLH